MGQCVQAGATVCAASLCTGVSVSFLCVVFRIWVLSWHSVHSVSLNSSMGGEFAHLTLYCHLLSSPLYLFNFSIKQLRDNIAN